MDPQTKAVVEFEQGTLSIVAAVVGRGLNVEPSLVPVRMREEKITVLCEHGLNEDAGRYRLNFFNENRRFHLVVDEAGNAVKCSTIDFGDRPLPAAMRRPSARPVRSCMCQLITQVISPISRTRVAGSVDARFGSRRPPLYLRKRTGQPIFQLNLPLLRISRSCRSHLKSRKLRKAGGSKRSTSVARGWGIIPRKAIRAAAYWGVMGFTIYLGISVVIMVEATGTRLFLVVAVFGVAFGAASLLEHLLRDSVPPDLLANGDSTEIWPRWYSQFSQPTVYCGSDHVPYSYVVLPRPS
jgi:hypothetical protein